MIIQPHPGPINAAVAAGAAALIDLEPGPLDRLPRVEQRGGRERLGVAGAPGWAGPGMVELAAGSEPWLLQVVSRRLSRVHANDRRFLSASAWLRVRAVTVSAASVAAITAAGDHIVVYRST